MSWSLDVCEECVCSHKYKGDSESLLICLGEARPVGFTDTYKHGLILWVSEDGDWNVLEECRV